MRLAWSDLYDGGAAAAVDQEVQIEGYPAHTGPAASATRFLLTAEPACCSGHLPRDPAGAVTITTQAPISLRSGVLRLRGTLRIHPGAGRRYELTGAQPVEPPGWRGVTRRGLLGAASLVCLAETSCAQPAPGNDAVSRVLASGAIDVHSHAGGIASVARMTNGVGFASVADPMRRGGMGAICWAIVSDGPTHRTNPDHTIHPFREPNPGELYQYGNLAFQRLHQVAAAEKLAVIRTRADLAAARGGKLSVVVSAEGADFLEGRIERVDEAYQRWDLRHLQLTHYRPNELGDIQTEAPVHGGLTDFGAAVIQHCNRIGVVVDVAHGPFDLVRRAASVTAKPLVLSHTSLTGRPGPRSRQISPDHAKLIAGTGGVIGVWPSTGVYPTLEAMALGMRRLADLVGVEHVALGTDMRGLTVPSVLPDYDRLPGLAGALLGAGFSERDVAAMLGGNYVRVFDATLG